MKNVLSFMYSYMLITISFKTSFLLERANVFIKICLVVFFVQVFIRYVYDYHLRIIFNHFKIQH